MSTKTLREKYVATKINELKSRLKTVDDDVKVIMSEDVHEKLIIEAFDKQQMLAATDIVKKLKAIDFGGLTTLAQARDAAVQDVTKALTGSQSTGLIRTIVNLFKGTKENPLVDALAFADALKHFFDMFTQYVAALGGQGADAQTLGQIVTGKTPDELADLSAVKGLDNEHKKKLNDLQKLILTGMKPQGALANIGKNWIDKYLKGTKGLKSFAKELLSISVKTLKGISSNVSTSLQNVEAVGQAAAGAAQQSSMGTTASTGTTAAQSGAASSGSVSTKSNATAPGAQIPAAASSGQDQKDIAKKAYDDLIQANVHKQFNIRPIALKAIVNSLTKKGYIK